jgi:hypothetical protein
VYSGSAVEEVIAVGLQKALGKRPKIVREIIALGLWLKNDGR